ncbi:MAG: WD40 repeat domain-containing protein [Candidatus Helarchaeota archaeon]
MFYKKFIISTKANRSEEFIKIFAISQDLKNIITGNWDNIIKIFDIQSCKFVRTLKGHSDSVYFTSVSSDNKYIASASFDKTIRLWDKNTGECIHVFQGHNDCINTVIFSHDNKYLISGSRDKTIKIWDINTKSCVKTLKGHVGSVEALTLTPDGEKLISGSTDGSIRIWNFKNRKKIDVLQDYGSIIYDIKVSPNGEYVISNSKNTIKIWNIETLDLMFTLTGHKDIIISFSISNDGNYLITGSENGHIIVWDLNSKKIINEIKNDYNIEFIRVYNSPKNLIELSFIHLDNDGNIVQWIKFNKDSIKQFKLFDRLEEDEFNNLLNSLIYSRVSFDIIVNDFNISKDEVKNTIKFLKDNNIIDGFFDDDGNFLSFLYVQDSIKEILNLSGKIEISNISKSLNIKDTLISKIINDMIIGNVINGYFNTDNSIFITHEELMSELLFSLKKNKIIKLDNLHDLFDVNKKVVIDIINFLIKRGDLCNIIIDDECIKTTDYEECVPIEILEPEEIVDVPVEITPERSTKQITKDIKNKITTVQKVKKKKTRIDDYINVVESSIHRMIKIFEILEIPAFYEETLMFFKELTNLQSSNLSKFITTNFFSKLNEFQDQLNQIISNNKQLSPDECHELEFKSLEIIQEFLETIKTQLNEYVKNLNEPGLFKVLNEAFNNFDKFVINQYKLYLENILDSMIIMDDKSNNIALYFRFRPTCESDILKQITDLLNKEKGKLIHDEFNIIEFKSNKIYGYMKKINNCQVILVTTGCIIPMLLTYFNDCISNINLKDINLIKKNKKRLEKMISNSFNFSK